MATYTHITRPEYMTEEEMFSTFCHKAMEITPMAAYEPSEAAGFATMAAEMGMIEEESGSATYFESAEAYMRCKAYAAKFFETEYPFYTS